MALAEGPLGLTVRVKLDVNVENIPDSARKIQRWLKELPVVDLGESATLVFRLLYDLNQSPFTPRERLHLLEELNDISDQLISSLSGTYIHSPLNHAPKLKSASDLVHALSTEQIFGYNAVIEDLVADPDRLAKQTKTVLVSACANALKCQGLIQLQRYQLYKTVASKVWQQQNIIYAKAVELGVLDQKIKSESSDLQSINHQFKRNITLSTCNPFQMKHGEVNECYQSLDLLSPLIEVTPKVNPLTLYAYSTSLNIAPQPSDAIDSENDNWLGIDLNQAVDAVENNAIENGQGFLGLFRKNTDLELTESLKIHLIEHWKTVKSRNFIRINTDDATQAAIGMAASHHFLVERLGEEVRERFFGKPKEKPMFETSGLSIQVEEDDSQHSFVWNQENTFGNASNTPRANDAFDSIYKPRDYEQRREENQNKPFKELKTRNAYEWVHGLIKDVSPAGFCLAFEKSPSNNVESNELVTVQNYKNGEIEYNLGLIRWNRWHNQDSFLIGVELISPQATPVRATLDWDYAKPAYHHNGLLLPEMPNVGVDNSIVLPPMGYRSGQTVAIMTPGQEYKIELTKRILQTSNFIQFQYQPK
ncbi:hypothetical protein [Kangiella sp. HZ709]|uniref:hypothetical protein n=1 Tax=Kangiella sp. HZ709 TaxID=2666328 RepID=UPI0012B031D4|nr:hypothetical protein [Kangiella sp. HZ709]MRX28531.1 hypothetical protein [Kangiella sp. HZ709]